MATGIGITDPDQRLDFGFMRTHARGIMDGSPIKYVREAELRGTRFRDDNDDDGEGGYDGVVSCADTKFWVDHGEPERVLAKIREGGEGWPLGKLRDGYEFLVIVEGHETRRG